jgi:hypothetical protein
MDPDLGFDSGDNGGGALPDWDCVLAGGIFGSVVISILVFIAPKLNDGGLVAPNPVWREKAYEGFDQNGRK